ncbi:MAG: response regulator transcription factor [Caldilineaceae bacterium]
MKGGLWILIVDTDRQMRRFLQSQLQARLYRVLAVETGQTALVKVEQMHPDLIILDLDLPDMSGLTCLKRLRARTQSPVIALSMGATVEEQIAALDAGADDFLAKPLRIDELLARMRVAQRRTLLPLASSIFTYGELRVDLTQRLVTVKGQRVQLTPHEYTLLRLLVLHSGAVLTYRQILCEIWGPEHSDAIHYVRVYIAQLRHKLEPDPKSPCLILNEPRVGYRLAILDVAASTPS